MTARPAADSAVPGRSRGGASGDRDGGTTASVPAMATAASTTFSVNTELQLNHSSSRPEASRPRMPLVPATPTHVPTALPRCSGGNSAVTMESVTGMTMAAPTPIAARSAISVRASSVNTAASAAPPKIARPPSSTRRRP
jgi:hypothetical protein